MGASLLALAKSIYYVATDKPAPKGGKTRGSASWCHDQFWSTFDWPRRWRENFSANHREQHDKTTNQWVGYEISRAKKGALGSTEKS